MTEFFRPETVKKMAVVRAPTRHFTLQHISFSPSTRARSTYDGLTNRLSDEACYSVARLLLKGNNANGVVQEARDINFIDFDGLENIMGLFSTHHTLLCNEEVRTNRIPCRLKRTQRHLSRNRSDSLFCNWCTIPERLKPIFHAGGWNELSKAALTGQAGPGMTCNLAGKNEGK